MTELGGFQDFLVNMGWRRYIKILSKPIRVDEELVGFETQDNYDSNFLSSYGPMEYFFSHRDYPNIELWYGLHIKGRPPVFSLSVIPVHISRNIKEPVSDQDIWYIIMQQLSYAQIYNCIIHQIPLYLTKEKKLVEYINNF